MEQVGKAGGLAIICHPAMHWLKHWDLNYAERHAPTVRVTIAPAMRSITQGDFTIESWFRTTHPGRGILMGNYQKKRGCSLNLELQTENRVRIYLTPEDWRNSADLHPAADTLGINTRDGKWHHLAAVRQDQTIYLYLDGRLIHEETDTAGKFDLKGDTYYLGRDTRSQSGETWFQGDLGPCRMWSRALRESEITAAFAGKAVGVDGGPEHKQLIAQYLMQSFSGKAGDPQASVGQIDDSAGHADGPFHASATHVSNPRYISIEPDASTPGAPTSAIRFAPVVLDPTDRGDGGVAAGVADYYAQKFRLHPHIVGIEFLNGTRSLSEHVLDRSLWDMILMRLMRARPVCGLAVDDMHRIEHLGKDWIWVLSSIRDK